MTILNNVKNQFHQPPLGPFLNYIKIKPDYQQWSLAVESILRPLLSSFVVFNSEDIITFNQIRENNHLRSGSSCYCKSEQCIEYDVSGYRPDPQYLTIMDTLEIHHPAIQNILIDILNIDVIILCNTKKKAEEILMSETGTYSMPRNVGQIVLINGDSLLCKNGSLLYTPFVKKFTPCLGVSVETQKEALEKDLTQYREELTELEQKKNEITEKAKAVNNFIRQVRAKITESEQKMDQYMKCISDITREMNRIQANDENDDILIQIQSYRDIANENQEQLTVNTTKKQQLQEELDKKKEEIQQMDAKIAQALSLVEKKKEEIELLQGTQHLQEIGNIIAKRDRLQDKINALQHEVDTLSQTCENTKGVVQEKIQTIGGEEGRPQESLDLKACTYDLQVAREHHHEAQERIGKENLSIEVVRHRYQKAKEDYDAAMLKYKTLYQAQQENLAIAKRAEKVHLQTRSNAAKKLEYIGLGLFLVD